MKKSSQIIYLIFFLALALIFSSTEKSYAEEQSAYTEMARERRYVGGADEADLKVQANAAAAAKNKPTVTQESNEGF